MTDIPRFILQCDDSDNCTNQATHILRLLHMKNTCEPQTVAICNHHIGDWIEHARSVQNTVFNKAPINCANCNTRLEAGDIIATLTQLTITEDNQ